MGCRLQTKGKPAVSLRVRYYFNARQSGLRFFFVGNFIGLSKNILGDFFMLKNGIKGLLVSKLMQDASVTKKLAYLGVTTAICVVSNMLLEFKMLDVQFSLTILVSVLLGVLLG